MKNAASQVATPTASLLADAAKIISKTLGADRYRVAGTAKIDSIIYYISPDWIAPKAKWVEI